MNNYETIMYALHRNKHVTAKTLRDDHGVPLSTAYRILAIMRKRKLIEVSTLISVRQRDHAARAWRLT